MIKTFKDIKNEDSDNVNIANKEQQQQKTIFFVKNKKDNNEKEKKDEKEVKEDKEEKNTSEEKKENKLFIPDFSKLKISTQTIIIITNLIFNINKLFNSITITDYKVFPKKRGRKKKDTVIQTNPVVSDGSIVTLKYQNIIKGVDIKQKKVSENNKIKYFRNSLTIVMSVDGKMINSKISKNGKFQITGCKSNYHAELFIKYLWEHIKNKENFKEFCEIKGGNKIEATFKNVMTNIDTNVGFNINRENLDQYINSNTKYHSLLETSVSYTGINIKIPIKKDFDFNMKKISCDIENNTWSEDNITYKNYIGTLCEKDRIKEQTKQRYHSILVFYSGNIIFSSMDISFMKDLYEEFFGIIKDCRHLIEDK